MLLTLRQNVLGFLCLLPHIFCQAYRWLLGVQPTLSYLIVSLFKFFYAIAASIHEMPSFLSISATLLKEKFV